MESLESGGYGIFVQGNMSPKVGSESLSLGNAANRDLASHSVTGYQTETTVEKDQCSCKNFSLT